MYFFGLLVGHQKPSPKFLNRYVRGAVGSKWHDLGIELLDFDDYQKLNTIKAEHPADLIQCCNEMFELWLRKQPTASWSQLIKALKEPSVELDTLANKIKQMLSQGKLVVLTLRLFDILLLVYAYIDCWRSTFYLHVYFRSQV